MLRSHDHKGYAEEGVGTGGVNFEHLIGSRKAEIDKCAGGTSDPVFLLSLDICREVNFFEAVKKLVGIFRYSQEPHVL